MQLVSQRSEVERPSDFDIAKRLLRDNLRENRGRYELWTNGNWILADFDAIMTRANAYLKSVGREQFKGKAVWIQ